MLEDKEHDWPIENQIDFNDSNSLLAINPVSFANIPRPERTYYSSISSYIDNEFLTGTYISMDTATHTATFRLLDFGILDMYRSAMRILGLTQEQMYSHLAILCREPGSLYYNHTGYFDDWKVKYQYCYEMRYGIGTSKSLLANKMVDDLNFYFHLEGRIVDSVVTCWIIKKNPNGEPMPITGNDRFTTIHYLCDDLNGRMALNPCDIDPLLQSNADKHILNLDDELFSDSKKTIGYYNNLLKPLGLIIVECRKKTKIFVLTDRP